MSKNINTSKLCDLTLCENDCRKTMIKVDGVSMVFNMASEQMGSLKEYAIQIARRKLFFEGLTALDNVSFEVKKGDVFGIVGTNGSGKSTLLKIIAGVLEPTKGSCSINGNIAPLIELGAGFDEELSARENIYLNGALLGYSKQFINNHFDEIVEFAEIEKFLDMPLKNYSSGMVARIAFAIATVIVPEILVVDEVLSVGDFMFQKKCENRINELIEKHQVTVLIVSHGSDQIERLCNKAIWVEKGHIRLQGEASAVCRVYSGLAGRIGAVKSEQRVFDALTKERSTNVDSYVVVAGDDASGTAVHLALRGWEDGFESVVLASSNTHINAVLAAPIAGAYQTPVLPISPERIPDAVMSVLREVRPRQIFVVDFAEKAKESRLLLESLPWQPDIITFSNRKSIFDQSLEIMNYGLSRGLWGSGLIALDFDDNPESLTASPLAYANKWPVLVMNKDFPLDRIAEIYLSVNAEVFAIASAARMEIVERLTACGFSVNRVATGLPQSTCLEICQLCIESFNANSNESNELCVASLSSGQWPELLGVGAYAGYQQGALLLVDTLDLDNMTRCFDFLESSKKYFKKMVFIGKESGLLDIDRELLSATFAS